MTSRERVLQFVDYRSISKNKFYKETGLSNGFLDKNNHPGADKLEQIIYTYPEINPEWLLIGRGSMLRNTKDTEKNENPPYSELQATDYDGKHIKNSGITKIFNPKEKTRKKLIPFYDIEAAAGTLQISDMTPVTEPDEWINAGDWFLDADSAMRVHGDSMFPVYKSGSIVVMREVYDKQLVIYGQDYMIETLEYRMIKRLQKSNMTGNWLACSINEETWGKGELAGRLIHEPFDVSIDNVIKLCRVLGCVTRNEGSRIVYTKNKSKV